MHHALAVGDRQRAGDLIQQSGSGLRGPGTTLERPAQVAAAQPAHDQVGAVRLAPVVVQGHDVQVLQPGHQLGFGLEAADEVGVVGVLGQDDFDGHVAPHRGLIGAVDHAEAARADALAQLVASDSPLSPFDHAGPELASEDALVQIPCLLGRLNAQLLAQGLDTALEDGGHARTIAQPAVGHHQRPVGRFGRVAQSDPPLTPLQNL